MNWFVRLCAPSLPQHNGSTDLTTFSQKLEAFSHATGPTQDYRGTVYPVRSVICKLFETRNNLKPGSRSGYKHVQVPQKGIYPRAPSALLLCSVSSLNHSHTCVSAHSGSLLLYYSRSLAVPGTHFAWIIWQHRLSEDLLSSPGTRFHMRGNLAKSSANPISHIHKGPQWQAAWASPDFHTNAHHSSTKMN